METEKIVYPQELGPVNWLDFANRAKTVLLLKGEKDEKTEVILYHDEFIEILFEIRFRSGKYASCFEVKRQKFPDHPKESLRTVDNPVYMEVSGECIRVHGEGVYIYQHIIDLSKSCV